MSNDAQNYIPHAPACAQCNDKGQYMSADPENGPNPNDFHFCECVAGRKVYAAEIAEARARGEEIPEEQPGPDGEPIDLPVPTCALCLDERVQELGCEPCSCARGRAEASESHDFANCADCIEATSRQLLAFVEKWPMDRTKHVVLHGRTSGLHGFSLAAPNVPGDQEAPSFSVYIGGGMTIEQSRQLAKALLSQVQVSK